MRCKVTASFTCVRSSRRVAAPLRGLLSDPGVRSRYVFALGIEGLVLFWLLFFPRFLLCVFVPSVLLGVLFFWRQSFFAV